LGAGRNPKIKTLQAKRVLMVALLMDGQTRQYRIIDLREPFFNLGWRLAEPRLDFVIV
jgi:hypothetical protein